MMENISITSQRDRGDREARDFFSAISFLLYCVESRGKLVLNIFFRVVESFLDQLWEVADRSISRNFSTLRLCCVSSS